MATDYRHLDVFLAVVQEGSLGRAAQALNRSQPAVSKAIKRLEESLEVPLFERDARGMIPTVYGEALLAHAELIASEAERARDDWHAATRAEIRFTCGATEYQVEAGLTAREGETEVFAKSWSFAVPRDHM